MTNSKGYRHGTRTLFARGHKKHGIVHLSKILAVYKVGDLVSIKANSAVQKGMPHKSYHGKTGRVYNVTQRGIGVIVNKRVRGKILAKRICVRVEHLHKNRAREEFVNRVKQNDIIRREAEEKGIFVQLKRQPEQPKEAHFIRVKSPIISLATIPYEMVA